jgi:hypothetical protein
MQLVPVLIELTCCVMAGAGSEFSLQAAPARGRLKPELQAGRAQRYKDRSLVPLGAHRVHKMVKFFEPGGCRFGVQPSGCASPGQAKA